MWAVDEDGTLYRYKELYGCVKGERNVGVKETVQHIGANIAALMKPEFDEHIYIRGVADRAIWDESGRGAIIEELEKSIAHAAGEKRGITFDKGNNARMEGKAQMHYRLAFDQEGRPGMYVTENCRAFIETIPFLPYSQTHVEDVDTTGEDHVYDETRYMLMNFPVQPRKNAAKKPRAYDPLA